MKAQERFQKSNEIVSFLELSIIHYCNAISGITISLNIAPEIKLKKDRDGISDLILSNSPLSQYIEQIKEFTSKKIVVSFKEFTRKELDTLIANYPSFDEKLYPSRYILDDTKSEEWNKTEITRLNNLIKGRKMKHHKFLQILKTTKEK